MSSQEKVIDLQMKRCCQGIHLRAYQKIWFYTFLLAKDYRHDIFASEASY